MALIIYPTADYDSFVTVADATTVIAAYTLHSATWIVLTTAEQEVYLRIAARNIIDHVDQEENPFPDPMTDCVADAQALMAINDVVYGFSASIAAEETGATKKEKVGTLEVEYYDTKKSSGISMVPTLAVPCLEALGYVFTPNIDGLAQLTLGRS